MVPSWKTRECSFRCSPSPFWWHRKTHLPADTMSEALFPGKGSPITTKLYEGGDISAVSKSLSTSTFSNSDLSRNPSAELPVKYIPWQLLQHDAQAKHFQTLDTSHVPTHVLAAILEALVQHLLFWRFLFFISFRCTISLPQWGSLDRSISLCRWVHDNAHQGFAVMFNSYLYLVFLSKNVPY